MVGVLEQLGGAASWRQLRRAGVSWYVLWRALQEGRVDRLRRGVYALPGADAAVREAVRLGGVLCCTSAALALGLPVLVAQGVHVVVPRSWGHARRDGVTVHRRTLADCHRERLTTSLLRTVLDCARELPFREAVVICDGALRAGLDTHALFAAAENARGPGSCAIRAVAQAADSRSESAIESCLRLVARAFGRVDCQVWISGVGRVDMLVDGWLVLEADGFEFHRDRRSYREDRRRSNALVAAGYVVLRFGYEDIVHHEDIVRCTIADVLARGRR